MTAPDKASQLLIQFGVASRIAAPDEQVRASTAFSLGRIGGDRAVELLLTALNDSTDGVRGAAAYALSETGDRRAIEPLERLLKQEKSEPIRQQIETALQQLKARAPRKL